MTADRIIQLCETATTLANILVANGTRFMRDFSKDDISKRQGANLPHWTIDNAIYHVRFSLADAIPQRISDELLGENRSILAKLKDGNELTGMERRKLIRYYSKRVESVLDAGHGACWLADERIATLTLNALRFFHGERYYLYAWVVMPNHVHTIIQPLSHYRLSEILHSWKSYTANKANKILNLSGAFWEKEYFDHILRDESRLIECIEYVYKNPEVPHLKKPWYRYKIEY